MASTILLLALVLLTISAIPWFDKKSNSDFHHTDLMAGDEGEM